MITALQIIIILLLISLIGVILGYLVGNISCKKDNKDSYINKSSYCENKAKEINKDQNDLLEFELKEIENSIERQNRAQLDALHNINVSNNQKSSNQDTNNNSKSKTKTSSLETTTTNYQASTSNDTSNSKDRYSSSEIKERLNALSSPENGKADNLCEIKGIGKVIEEKLHNLGIFHFHQIASWGEAEIELVDNHLSFKGRIVRENWIEQAKQLAKGKETEFAQRVKKGEVPSSSKS